MAQEPKPISATCHPVFPKGRVRIFLPRRSRAPDGEAPGHGRAPPSRRSDGQVSCPGFPGQLRSFRRARRRPIVAEVAELGYGFHPSRARGKKLVEFADGRPGAFWIEGVKRANDLVSEARVSGKLGGKNLAEIEEAGGEFCVVAAGSFRDRGEPRGERIAHVYGEALIVDAGDVAHPARDREREAPNGRAGL